MINTQLHNELIEYEIQRKSYEAQKRVQEAKTQILKERLIQALYITGFFFIVLLLMVILFWLFPTKSINCPICPHTENKKHSSRTVISKNNSNIKTHITNSQKNNTAPFNGVEYIKENNYIYKRIYKDGVMVQELKLAPTITESKEKTHENIPQFSTLKKNNIEK